MTIEIRKLENDFMNKLTVATVDVFETISGIQRLRDTFVIKLDGIMDIGDDSLPDVIYGKLHDIGYEIVVQTNAPYTPPVNSNPANDADPIPSGE